MRPFLIVGFLLTSVTFHCCSQVTKSEQTTDNQTPTDSIEEQIIVDLPYEFSRDSIVSQLVGKQKQNAQRMIYVLVPLCDNEHQGIVRVNKSLGDGLNLRTNLYWGAGYGIKTHFTRSEKWTLLSSTMNPNQDVLERIILKHKSSNVVLVADAYRGDRMEACLKHYFGTLAGDRIDSVSISDSTFKMTPDLVVFNGHNGLMDVPVEATPNVDGKAKDAIAIACFSMEYFKERINISGGYPLVFTSHFLAPEAYVLHPVFEAWIANKTPEEIRFSAAQGYHGVQKCGMKGASNLFVTGW